MKGVPLILVCLFALGGASLLSLGVGRYPVSPLAILSWLLTGRSADSNLPVVLLNIRLPRLIAAIAAGGALSLSGAAYQGLFRNPMVSPDILGVSSGSGFGAALGILFSLPVAAVQALSLAGGITAVFAAVLVSRAIGRNGDSVLVLVLSGIVISSLFGALLSLLKYIADPLDKLPAITYWLMGSFADIRTGELGAAVAMVFAGAIPLLLVSWRLNVLSFGEEEARSLGLHTERMRVAVILSATLVTASMISICGIIGWVGLVVPHISRFLGGANHRRLMPVSFLVGAAFMVAVDTVARSAASVEIPVGIITAVLGAPFFIWIMKRSSLRAW
ncbi:MAG TPA: iron ABC transporter permease [Chlorobaculum sp.]|uniref:Iron(III) ABC transporter, permease protein n=1 Tax=Chlorobaculum tepidum (strain ATCC 49652 / DSM 12025 / NBRC 103806 / TLS) TaxID=194439 RepID=Q8KBM5_CHLTE|nr:iron ABC transporter permease [Chlorobaculum tepidum]AAM72982.1 iron(III) ABC transporter, permease protein [Chlorobaculum tepidum TLS]HBU24428.1 iron ABC transporter permease [Chlorobaculum sp.]